MFDNKPADLRNVNKDPERQRTRTYTDDIKINDGMIKLHITNWENGGSGLQKYTQYNIEGHDSLGDINIVRRYSEFFLFQQVLFKRYPGLFIPPTPPKAVKNNMGEHFLAERVFFLN